MPLVPEFKSGALAHVGILLGALAHVGILPKNIQGGFPAFFRTKNGAKRPQNTPWEPCPQIDALVIYVNIYMYIQTYSATIRARFEKLCF